MISLSGGPARGFAPRRVPCAARAPRIPIMAGIATDVLLRSSPYALGRSRRSAMGLLWRKYPTLPSDRFRIVPSAARIGRYPNWWKPA
jgi:hypothetical protein